MPLPRTLDEAAALLGVSPDAEPGAVGERYRKLAQIYHPDLNPGAPDAEARMQELNIARDLLLQLRDESALLTTDTDPHPSLPREDEQRIAAVMHEMPYGVYFIGSVRDGEPSGMIADWVLQISFRPRLVLCAFERDSYSLASIERGRSLTISLLAEDCFDVAGRFLQPRDPSKVRGRSRRVGDAPRQRGQQLRDKLAGADYWTTQHGCPVLTDSLTWLDCDAEQFIPAGDHVLVISRVLDGGIQRDGEPLTSLNTGWNYSG